MHIFKFFISFIFFISSSLPAITWVDQAQEAIGIAPLISEAQDAFDVDAYFQQFLDASDGITEFIKEQFAIRNIEVPQGFCVKLTHQYEAGRSVIGIPATFIAGVSDLEVLFSLMGNDEISEEKRNQYHLLFLQHLGSIDHEITHIAKNHVRKGALARIGISLTAIAALKLFEYHNKTLHKFIQNGPFFEKLIYAMSTGAALYAFNRFLYYMYIRNYEIEADEGIRNNPGVLFARIKYFNEIQEELKTDVKTRFGEKGFALFEKFPTLYLLYDPEHPILPERIDRLNERLQTVLLNQELQEIAAQESNN